jgi:hypothetical protein
MLSTWRLKSTEQETKAKFAPSSFNTFREQDNRINRMQKGLVNAIGVLTQVMVIQGRGVHSQTKSN